MADDASQMAGANDAAARASDAGHEPTAEDAGVWATDASGRERIPGSALVPGCVSWSEDGRLAVVADASVLIATFRSRELEMYLQQSPAVSKSFVFPPECTSGEHLPVPIPVFREVSRAFARVETLSRIMRLTTGASSRRTSASRPGAPRTFC